MLIASSVFCGSVGAAPKDDGNEGKKGKAIHLKSRDFVPTPGVDVKTKKKLKIEGDRARAFIQFQNSPLPRDKKNLRILGVKLLDYTPDDTWFASIYTDFPPLKML